MERAFYFAVFEGRKPGVYSLWNDFEAQVKDFEGYRYDVYLSEAAAFRAFNRYCQKTGRVDLIHLEPERYFVVYVGRTPGVYSTWRKAEAQLSDFEGSRYGVFTKRIDAFRAFETHCQAAEGIKANHDCSESQQCFEQRQSTSKILTILTETNDAFSGTTLRHEDPRHRPSSSTTTQGFVHASQRSSCVESSTVTDDIDDAVFESLFDVMEEHNYFRE